MLIIKGTKNKLVKMIKHGSSVRFWKVSKSTIVFERHNNLDRMDCLGPHTWRFENNRRFDSLKEAEQFVNTYIMGELNSLKQLEE